GTREHVERCAPGDSRVLEDLRRDIGAGRRTPVRGEQRRRRSMTFEWECDAAVTVGALGRGEIGDERMAEDLVRETVRVDRARMEHVRVDGSIDEGSSFGEGSPRGSAGELDTE